MFSHAHRLACDCLLNPASSHDEYAWNELFFELGNEIPEFIGYLSLT